MKSLLLSFSLFLLCLPSFSQETETRVFNPSFVAKWAPAGLAFGKISIGTEYNFKHKKSVTFNIGIPSSFDITQNIDNVDRTLTMKTFSVMGGYRMYLGKRPMTGVYFEPYLKYLDNKTSTNTDFDLDGNNKQFLVTSNYKGVGLGAQLGVQFMIAKSVVFDFYFLGPEANSATFDLDAQETGAGSPWDNAEAADAESEINNFLNDVPLLGNNTTFTVNAAQRNVHATFKGFVPGIRFGISIGVRF